MADFDKALPFTLKSEGGYSNNPDDTGKMTFAGISRVNNPNWSGWATIDQYKAANDLHNIDSLLQNETLMQNVSTYYKANYWDVNRLSDINDQQIAAACFDTGVNMGIGRAAKFLQMAANVTPDGIIGNQTIVAVNSLSPQLVSSNFNTLRKNKYLSIIAANPSQEQFKASWFSRILPYQS